MTREERGKKAAYFRTEAGLTRKELGSRLHLTEQEVSEYEAGTGGIPKNIAAAYARALGIDPLVFLQETGFLPEGFPDYTVENTIPERKDLDARRKTAKNKAMEFGGRTKRNNTAGEADARIIRKGMSIQEIREFAGALIMATNRVGDYDTHQDRTMTEEKLLTAVLIFLIRFSKPEMHTLYHIRRLAAAAEESPGDNNPEHTVLYSVFEGCRDIAADLPVRIACEYYRAYRIAPEHVRRMALSCLLGRLTDIRFRGQTGFWDICFD